ncbi:Zinc uptake regulation protein Zur [uncultured Synechococcales cyanobacterium]|uniref:Zinc uptake regulation protein Zur n=1 Tax=uncultured Synechococcales cyanobacterium TaxID=1936017 RepID=A0A6J4VMR2_9CYAN|nr:Zinc uptake regulation protein Zur [uncultured Synechococcales cyanobacterium]
MEAQRTRSQEQILQLLGKLGREISAQALYVELRHHRQGVGLATVYRSLEALKLGGVVQARTLANGEAVYSLVQEDKHHLTCLQCGASVPIDACPVHELEAQLQTSKRFRIYYHTLEFFGLCSLCEHQHLAGA